MPTFSFRLALAIAAVLAAGSPAFADAALNALQPAKGGCEWVRFDAGRRDVLAKLPLDATQATITWSRDGRKAAIWRDRVFCSENGQTPIDLHWPADRDLLVLNFDAQDQPLALAIPKARQVGHTLRFEGRSYPAKPSGDAKAELVQALRYVNGRWQVLETASTHEDDIDNVSGGAGVWALKTRIGSELAAGEWGPKSAIAADPKLGARLSRMAQAIVPDPWLLLPTPYGRVACQLWNGFGFALIGPIYLLPTQGAVVKVMDPAPDGPWRIFRQGPLLLASARDGATEYDLTRRRTVLHVQNAYETQFWPATAQTASTGADAAETPSRLAMNPEIHKELEELLKDLNPGQRQVLLASQSAWEKFRGPELAFESLRYADSPHAAQEQLAIANRLDRDRLQDLDDCRRRIDNAPQDAYRTLKGVTVEGALKSNKNYQRDDAELNQVYRQVAQAPWVTRGDGKKLLVQAQLAWLVWRDAQAKLDVVESTEPAGAYSDMLDDATSWRASQLKKLMNGTLQ